MTAINHPTTPPHSLRRGTLIASCLAVCLAQIALHVATELSNLRAAYTSLLTPFLTHATAKTYVYLLPFPIWMDTEGAHDQPIIDPIATGFSEPVYEATQSFVHVLVTHSFLRSLATLELAESRVRRLSEPDLPVITADEPPVIGD